MKVHMRQSSNCTFVQKLKINETSKVTIVTQFDIQSETYLKNLYNFLVYREYDLEEIVIETKEIVDVAVNFKSRFKIKFNKFFKSFKSEKFAINLNFNSTSSKSCFESIIKSDAVLEFDSKKAIIKAKTIVAAIKKTIEQAVIETVKSEIIAFKNINFFDFIMQINL